MESNLRDAIDYLVNLGDENAEPKVVEIDGKLYCNKSLKRYDETPKASPISGASLTALMDYIINNPAELPDRKMILHVTAPMKCVSILHWIRNGKGKLYLLPRQNFPDLSLTTT